MRTLVHQASLFALFALGLAGLMAALCHDATHGPCFALCCGLIPGLTAALFVPTLTAGVSALVRARGCRRQSPTLQSERCNPQPEIAAPPGLACCALASWLATLWLSVEVCPLVCARLCGPCSHTNAGTVGVCAFFFGALGLAAGLTIVEAGLLTVSADRRAEPVGSWQWTGGRGRRQPPRRSTVHAARHPSSLSAEQPDTLAVGGGGDSAMTLQAIGKLGKRGKWLCLSLAPALVLAALCPATSSPVQRMSSACGTGSQTPCCCTGKAASAGCCGSGAASQRQVASRPSDCRCGVAPAVPPADRAPVLFRSNGPALHAALPTSLSPVNRRPTRPRVLAETLPLAGPLWVSLPPSRAPPLLGLRDLALPQPDERLSSPGAGGSAGGGAVGTRGISKRWPSTGTPLASVADEAAAAGSRRLTLDERSHSPSDMLRHVCATLPRTGRHRSLAPQPYSEVQQ